MTSLLLRLSGPLQSWGVQSRFDVRETGREPSKSGVIGLLCAALGRARSEPLDDLTRLRMGVRADQEGRLERDYQTAGKDGYRKAGGAVERKSLIVSRRYYLADARFLVGLEGDADLLERLHTALRDPVWPLYLGRKAFVPGEPVWLPDGLREGKSLLKALRQYPWLGAGSPDTDRLRLVIDDPGGAEMRPDLPLTFAGNTEYYQGFLPIAEVRLDLPLSFAERRFAARRVRVGWLPAPPLRQEEDDVPVKA